MIYSAKNRCDGREVALKKVQRAIGARGNRRRRLLQIGRMTDTKAIEDCQRKITLRQVRIISLPHPLLESSS